jgi:thiamine pyrophosphokinase
MRAIIFVNGTIENYGWVHTLLRGDDFIIGADGGTRHALIAGRIPDVVVGDMDSLPPHLLAEMERLGVPLERHPVHKDATDLELAIQRAVKEGASEVLLLGAVGSRLDQTLANLLISAQAWPIPVTLVNDEQRAQALRSGECMTITASVGKTVSAIPLSPDVKGITYQGLAYPLQDATLRLGSTRGISNVVAEESATICVGEGVLLIVQEGEEREA